VSGRSAAVAGGKQLDDAVEALGSLFAVSGNPAIRVERGAAAAGRLGLEMEGLRR
jgi:hypothetical protein